MPVRSVFAIGTRTDSDAGAIFDRTERREFAPAENTHRAKAFPSRGRWQPAGLTDEVLRKR